MHINKDIVITILILFLVQIVVWFQLNGQLINQKFKDNAALLSLLGIPISYCLILSTHYGYRGFGELWPIRLLGFAAGMLTFPFITYWILGEGITLKTAISILLSIAIMIIQFL